MRRATLTVSRVGEDELRFTLQRIEDGPPVVLRASTVLPPESRRSIRESYRRFAECEVGSYGDEPALADLGRVVFRIVVPPLLQKPLRELSRPLTILTDDPFLPWEVMHDGRDFLALRLPLARILMVSEQLGALLEPLDSDRTGGGRRALVVADPEGNLPGARAEGESLRALFAGYGDCRLLSGPDATFANVATALVAGWHSVVHFCGHVDYDDRWQLSTVRLADGSANAHDLAATLNGAPLVFLNACYSDAPLVPERAATRAESFAQAFMIGRSEGAASAVVGTMWRVPDEPEDAVRGIALRFYEHLLAGGTIGEALRRSREMARGSRLGPMAWAPYVLYGDPCNAPCVPRFGIPSAGRESKPGAGWRMASAPDLRLVAHGSQPGVAGELYLDSSARAALRAALASMRQFKHGLFTSLHLLLGLCETGIPPLPDSIRRAGESPERVASAVRAKAAGLARAGGHIGLTRSVRRALQNAAELASRDGRCAVTGQDILAGLLQCGRCEATRTLSSLGFRPHALVEEGDTANGHAG